MHTETNPSMDWYGYYKPLLERYARRLLREEAAAVKLVGLVLDFHGSVYGNTFFLARRRRLKESTQLSCFYYVQCRNFDRPPVGCRKNGLFL